MVATRLQGKRAARDPSELQSWRTSPQHFSSTAGLPCQCRNSVRFMGQGSKRGPPCAASESPFVISELGDYLSDTVNPKVATTLHSDWPSVWRCDSGRSSNFSERRSALAASQGKLSESLRYYPPSQESWCRGSGVGSGGGYDCGLLTTPPNVDTQNR